MEQLAAERDALVRAQARMGDDGTRLAIEVAELKARSLAKTRAQCPLGLPQPR